MADKIELNPTARVAKNSLVQLVGGVLNKIMAVLLVIYAARQLGTHGFGVYSLVLAMLGIFYILTDFGLGTLATRDLARNPESEQRYLSNIFIMRLFLSLLAGLGLVGAAAALGHPPAVIGLTAIAALSLFFTSNVDTCTAVFNAHQRMEIPAVVSVIATMLRVGVSLGALAAGAGLVTLLVIYTSAAAVQFGLLLAIVGSRVRLRPALDWAFWRRLLGEAYPLALANLFSIIYFRIDTVMLASLSGEEAVGLYNAAYRLLEFTLMLPAYYTGAIFPVISASQTANPQRFLLIYRRSLKYMLVASLPLALGTAALAPELIEVLYGPAYAASISVLPVLMWSFVLIAANSINAPYLISMGRQRTVTGITLFSMLLNIALNAYAIPRHGILGAAWVTLLSEVVTLGLCVGVLSRPLTLKVRMLRHLLRPALAGIFMYGCVRLVPRWDLGYQILLGGLVYVGLLFLFRAFDEVDMEIFRRVLRPTWNSDTRLTG